MRGPKVVRTLPRRTSGHDTNEAAPRAWLCLRQNCGHPESRRHAVQCWEDLARWSSPSHPIEGKRVGCRNKHNPPRRHHYVPVFTRNTSQIQRDYCGSTIANYNTGSTYILRASVTNTISTTIRRGQASLIIGRSKVSITIASRQLDSHGNCRRCEAQPLPGWLCQARSFSVRGSPIHPSAILQTCHVGSLRGLCV